ncbi:hypothetical protein HA402_006777 [Bradysia odoriphaga]|nr:hypothetical protein HA402_006777 [Bradysia odoriphaga]
MKYFFVVLLAFIAFQYISAGLGNGIGSNSWANGINFAGSESGADGIFNANGIDNIEVVPKNVENEQCDGVLGGVLCLVGSLVDPILGP